MKELKPVQVNVPEKLVLTNAEYHAHPAVGSSQLKQVLRSPAHYKYCLENPPEPTAAMALGTAIHEAILEPNLFLDNALVMPKFEGKGCREKKDQWLIENADKRILTADNMDVIRGVLRAVEQHKTAKMLLKDGVSEESYFWQDAKTNLICKARPDFLQGGHRIIDLKTTSDASFSAFQRTISTFKYHLQGAHYADGVSQVIGQTFDSFTIIAVETSAPFGVQVFDLDQATMEKGLELRDRALAILAACKRAMRYPGYPDQIVDMNLPPWAWSE